MNTNVVLSLADAYLASHWEEMVHDIDALVRIPSAKDEALACEGAPWGPGPRAGLDAGLALAQRFGFVPHDLAGRIGFADLPGASAVQLGIIGHMDVVPAGPGWHFEPYRVTRKDGFLIGRGVIDDKGPSVVALHAVNLLRENAVALFGMERLPHTVRFIFGADEECGMGDVPYYRAAEPDPAFLFTPDADFPVCHGEKGHYDALAVSSPIEGGAVRAIEGGQAPNAVPGVAWAEVEGAPEDFPTAERIAIEAVGEGLVRITATGKSAHAAFPEGGVSAIGILGTYLCENVALCPEERAFFGFVERLVMATDGSGVGAQAWDEQFAALTMVGGMVYKDGGRLVQTIDARYPTSTDAAAITARLQEAAEGFGVAIEGVHAQEPFLMSADSPEIQALLAAYCEVTGEDAQPFTMGGGTYAREFSNAASFGPVFPGAKDPAWVGGMHGPDEGVAEDTLRQAFRIYAVALANLMLLDL